VPDAEVAEDFLDNARVINNGDDAHRILANGAPKRIHVPHAEDEVAPAFGKEFGRGWRGDAGAANQRFGGQSTVADAAGFVRVPPIVTHHLCALVGDVLGDGGQEVAGSEDFEVAVDLALRRER